MNDKRDLELKIAWLENIAMGRGDENERLREQVQTYRTALKQIRNALADMCPAWALEWPAVRAAMLSEESDLEAIDGEDYTAQDVRDCVKPALDAICAVLREVKL
jgi:hypothetical protein